MNTPEEYTHAEEMPTDSGRHPNLTIQVNRQTYIHRIAHSQGIGSQQVTINQSPPNEIKLLQDMIGRLEKENERLRSLMDKLMERLP